MKTRMVSPGRTIGFSELASSLMLRTSTPCSWATLFRLKSLVMTLQSNTLASSMSFMSTSRVQKMANLNVQIVEEDFPQTREVDMKLIELAKVFDCKVITNDFNLNKVAQLHGVEVLNINELANSLKPIVLPGETMRVFILKEGKEYNQVVAYLDDGTMVVVDNAKKMISKTIDISVTSVLQTTAGKMIFGKYDERGHTIAVAERHDRPVRKSDPQPMSNLPPEKTTIES